MDEGIILRQIGLKAYEETFKEMLSFTNSREDSTADEVWLLEHQPCFTLGFNGDKTHIHQVNEIPVIKSDRGGNVTYHGPGQIMGYLLIDIARKNMTIHDLVRATENLIIAVLDKYQIKGHTLPKAPGVYVDNKKICSLGFRVRKGRSYHGFALNVDMDLGPFKQINPCGYEKLEMTQISNYVQNYDTQTLHKQLFHEIEDNLGYNYSI